MWTYSVEIRSGSFKKKENQIYRNYTVYVQTVNGRTQDNQTL